MTGAATAACFAFDFDGTLVNSNAIKRAAYDEVLADVAGGPVTVARILRESPRDDRHAVFRKVAEALRAEGAPSLPPAEVWIASYSGLCEERVTACPAIPHAVEVLESLAACHPLYVVSATPEDALVRIVHARGWQGFFRGVYGGPRTKVENLHRVACQEALAPERLVYVGDGAVDREAAETFGCRFLGYGTPVASLGEGPLSRLVGELSERSHPSRTTR